MKNKVLKQTTFAPIEPKFNRKPQKTKHNSKSLYHPTESRTPEDILSEIEQKHGKSKFYMLYSGGRDSGVVADWLAENNKLAGIVHIKTNIGMKMTEDFVRDYCKQRDWKLYVVEPIPKFIYVSQVLQYGFPGPHNHRVIMGRLKYTAMQVFMNGLKDKAACFVSGIRQSESVRRHKNFLSPIQQDGKVWFVNPFFYVTNEEMYKMRIIKNLPVSPSYDSGLSISGDCLCGCYATYQVKDILKKADPHLADFIAWLEEGARKFGAPPARRYSKWGQTSKMSEIDQQTQLDNFEKDFPNSNMEQIEIQTCTEDCGPGTMKGMTDY